MDDSYIREILKKVSSGQMNEAEAFEELRELPYKDLGFANVDHHRAIRTGFPEVIYCEGKTSSQIRDIFKELSAKASQSTAGTDVRNVGIMGTRASREAFACVKEAMPDAIYHEEARIIELPGKKTAGCRQSSDGSRERRVAVISAGTADIPVAEEAAVTAGILGNDVIRIFDVGVAGIHRLFDRLGTIKSADVIIVVAGMEGALASVVGGLVDVPVIAVPTSVGYGANFSGLSALLSMLNSCANGVAVVNIDNGFGAAYMASVINRTKGR